MPGFWITIFQAPRGAWKTSKSAARLVPSPAMETLVGTMVVSPFFSRVTVAAGSKPVPVTSTPSAGRSSRTFFGRMDFTFGAGPKATGER